MKSDHLELLKAKLNAEFVPLLPPLLDSNTPTDRAAAQNTSRALSAFALQKLASVDSVTASAAVIDDFEDNGIDAILYHQLSRKLFLVQSKLRTKEPFKQAEAATFRDGVCDLLNQRFEKFNQNVVDRQDEIDSALDDAKGIILVVAHAASISQHASDVLNSFLDDAPDERLEDWVDYGEEALLEALLEEHQIPAVNDELIIHGEKNVKDPRVLYYGQIPIKDLAELYRKHGNALLEKNIRYFLGLRSSSVNRGIQKTLEDSPEQFFFLNNGVTATAHTISPRALRDGGRRFKVEGLSVINGAQTIASSAQFIADNPDADLDGAKVMITLIQVDDDDPFGVEVTKARNHQNPVSSSQFAALDGTQERLRREMKMLGIDYRYRPESRATAHTTDSINLSEAAAALALFHSDPSFPISLKKEPSKLLNASSEEYQKLFSDDLTGKKTANAVRFFRAAERFILRSENFADGQEKLIYRHGRYGIIWLTLGANTAWLERGDVVSEQDADTAVSPELDDWRERVRAAVVGELQVSIKGPLAFFRNLTTARPFLGNMKSTAQNQSQ